MPGPWFALDWRHYCKMRAPLFAALLIAPALRICHGSEASLRNRLQAEAPAGWAKLIQQAKRLECKVVDTRTWIGFQPPRAPQVTEHVIKFADHNALYHQTSFGNGSHDEFIVGINSDYSFRIERVRADRPWIVAYVGRDPSRVKAKFEGDADALARICLQVGDMWLPELMKARGFEIKDVVAVDRGGSRFVNLDFRYSPSPESSSFIRGGSIVLDTANNWAIREYTLQTVSGSRNEPGQMHVDVEYDSDAGGELVLKRVQERVPSEPAREFHWLHEYETYQHRAIPDADFRLSAYGLPELGEPPGLSRGRLWALFIVLGIICFIVAVILRRRSLQQR
ncbi:MAG: hypothetical protein HY288_10600 [Planctomycetia bacterium]|nr:hypothetical protein [Planctomycetia bacterium]